MYKTIVVGLLASFVACSAKPALDAKIESKPVANKNTTKTNSGATKTCKQLVHDHAALPYGDKCYIPMNIRMPWHQAQEYCSNQLFGRLAFVEDYNQKKAIYDFLVDMYSPHDLPKRDDGSWSVGLLQVNTEYEPKKGWAWVNSDGSVHHDSTDSNTPWLSGEPNDFGIHAENCGSLMNWADGLTEFGLNDNDCYKSLLFICEIVKA